MHNKDVQSKLIKILSESPFIDCGCKKVGIGRTTFYRWKKDNRDFRNEVNEALEYGRAHLNEFAESALLKCIKEGNFPAIRFYLEHNNPNYIPKRSVYMDPSALSQKERQEYEYLRKRKNTEIDTYRIRKTNAVLDRIIARATPEEQKKLLEICDQAEHRKSNEEARLSDESASSINP